MPPLDQFLLIDDAAEILSLTSQVLRQGIACGLIPIRRDNTGAIRIHQDDIPDNLSEKINHTEIQPELHAIVQADALVHIENRLRETETQRSKLEVLVQQQGILLKRAASLLGNNGVSNATISRAVHDDDYEIYSGALASTKVELSAREAEIAKLSHILERTFRAIDRRDQLATEQTGKLTQATNRAMQLLDRAIREGESTTEKLNSANQQIVSLASASARLEQELEQRNLTIKSQHDLIERMVALAENTATNTPVRKHHKRSIWQRLFGGGKGI